MEPQLGHASEEVPTMEVSPDGRYLLTAATFAKVWDLESGKIVRTFSAGTGRGLSHARFVGARDVLLVDAVGAWVVRDAITGEHRRGRATTQKDGVVSRAGVFVSPDAKRLGILVATTTSANGDTESAVIVVAALETGEKLSEIRPGAIVKSWAFSPDSKSLALGFVDAVRVYDVDTGRLTNTFAGRTYRYQNLAFTPDGAHVIAHTPIGDEFIWDLKTGDERERPHHPKIEFMAGRRILAADRMLATDGFDVVLVNLESAEIVRTFPAIPRKRNPPDDDWLAPAFVLTPDGKRLITHSVERGEVIVFDFASARELLRFDVSRPLDQEGLAFSPDGKTLVTAGDKLEIWDLASLHLKMQINASELVAARFTDKGEIVALQARGMNIRGTQVDTLFRYDAETGRARGTTKFPAFEPGVTRSIPPNGNALDVTTRRTTTRYDATTGDKLWTHGTSGIYKIGAATNGCRGARCGLRRAPAGRMRVTPWDDGVEASGVEVFSLDADGWNKVHSFETPMLARLAWLDPTDRYVLLAGNDREKPLQTWDVVSENKVADLPVTSLVRHADFLGGNRAIVGTDDGTVEVWDILTGKRVWTKSLHALPIVDLEVSPDRQLAASISGDGLVRLWRLDTGASLALISTGSGWAIYDDDGTFEASHNGGKLVAAIDGERTYQIDQLASRTNRPDLLLERIGFGDPDTIAHLRARHERRLAQQGLDKERIASFADAPRAQIAEAKQTGKSLAVTFDVTAVDELRSYQIWANGVPLLGTSGKPTRGTKLHVVETVELTSGLNRIEVAAIDRSGRESLRASHVARYDAKTRGDLYYLAFGVSSYKNKRYDLQYAHKDALDLGDVLKRAQGYSRINVKVLTDRDVTVANVRDAKKFLAAAKVDDTVIVFVAGHGVHARDRAADYYFATHEVDIDKLATTAAPFELIENLVQDIAPRRKLMLLDTCESGGADPGDLVGTVKLGANARDLRSRALVRVEASSRAEATTSPAVQLKPVLLDRDRYIYNDLVRRSGAVVISSSRGTESSFELETVANGVFTEVMLRVLTGLGTSRTEAMSFREFAAELAAQVPGTTQDLQHPTLDRDNLDVEILLPITPAARDIVDRR